MSLKKANLVNAQEAETRRNRAVGGGRTGRTDKLAVSPSLQAAMIAATPVRAALNLGHAAFDATPVELTRAIEAAAR